MQKCRYFVPRTRTRGDWYELYYLEKQSYIFVFRDEDKEEPRYVMRVRRAPEDGEVFLDCVCVGSNYGECQHVKNSKKYFDFGKVRRVRNFEDKTMEAFLGNYLQNYLAQRGHHVACG